MYIELLLKKRVHRLVERELRVARTLRTELIVHIKAARAFYEELDL